MRSLILLPLFALLHICQAFTSPDIYSVTQPAGASPDLGANSQPATVPSQSRYEDQIYIVVVVINKVTIGMQLDRTPD
jgi:hypothetical protein